MTRGLEQSAVKIVIFKASKEGVTDVSGWEWECGGVEAIRSVWVGEWEGERMM